MARACEHVRMTNDASLTSGEESVVVLHPHWKTLVWPIAATFGVVVVLLVVEVIIPASGAAGIERLLLLAVALILLMWWLMVPLLRWRTTTYELTTRRMRIRDGIIARNGRDFPLSRIVNISFRTGLLDRLVGSGTLILETAGEHGDLTLKEIPRVQQVQSMLFQLVEDEQTRIEAERESS
jgi:uncharacterized membrane protein YdbT with pleckstrin-like domain